MNTLGDVIRPFDTAIERAQTSDIYKLVEDIRDTFGIKFGLEKRADDNIWFKAAGELRPSELFEKLYEKVIPEGQKAIEDLKDAMEIDLNNLSEIPEKYQESITYPRHNDKQAELFLLFTEKKDNLESIVAGLEEIRDFFNTAHDETTQFFISSLDDEAMNKMKDLIGRAKEVIGPAKAVLKTATVQRSELLTDIIGKANGQLDELTSWMRENAEAFDMMDLKLHDASSYEYREMEENYPHVAAMYKDDPEDSAFYEFCESTYDQFKKWLEEEGIDLKALQHQVGRTSKFYLHDEGNGICLNRHDYSIDVENSMECLLDNYGYAYQDMRFDKDGHLDPEYVLQQDNENDFMENLLYIASGDFTKEVKSEYADTIKVFEYIKDTKENQVEYFKQWLEGEEEFAKERVDLEEER